MQGGYHARLCLYQGPDRDRIQIRDADLHEAADQVAKADLGISRP